MKHITRTDIEKLKKDPLSYAMMMDRKEIENVLVVFVSVLNKQKSSRGGQN